ncbi:unnamed protein product [Prunus armeniaca]|uniref:Uncharacterized protein n=1 Tax=Prunus armeniaca TaxID=36596 RepID=A0A6J5UC16_PRUAR|nr:unnamed protein product [Prunus armeniaca]
MSMQRTSLEFIPELNLLNEEEAQTQARKNRKIVQHEISMKLAMKGTESSFSSGAEAGDQSRSSDTMITIEKKKC